MTCLEVLSSFYPEVQLWAYIHAKIGDSYFFDYSKLHHTPYWSSDAFSNLDSIRQKICYEQHSYKCFNRFKFKIGEECPLDLIRFGFSFSTNCETLGALPISVSSNLIPARVTCAIQGGPIQSHIQVFPVLGATPDYPTTDFTRLSSELFRRYSKKYDLPLQKPLPFFFIPGEAGVAFRQNDLEPVLLNLLDLGVLGAEYTDSLFDKEVVKKKTQEPELPIIRF